MRCISSFGVALSNHLGKVEEGIGVAELADIIKQKHKCSSLHSRVHVALWAFTKPWKLPIRECISPLESAAQPGFLSGDIEMACLCLYCANCASFLTSAPLHLIQEESAHLNEQFSRRHQETLLLYLRITQQVVQNLQGLSKNCLELQGDFLDATAGLELAQEAGDVCAATLIRLFQCFLAVYLNDPGLAKQTC